MIQSHVLAPNFFDTSFQKAKKGIQDQVVIPVLSKYSHPSFLIYYFSRNTILRPIIQYTYIF